MTVAAGFVCNNGIVLGADSEITHSLTSRTNESKIFRIHPEGDVFLTYCGDTDFIKDLINQMRHFIETSGIANIDADDCLSLIRSIYEANMDKELGKPEAEIIWSELLVAVRRDKRHLFKAELEYETALYHLYGKKMIPVDRYAVIGIGNEIARSIFETRYSWIQHILEGAIVMVDALRRVKDAVPGCGGPTEIFAITGATNFFMHEFGAKEIKQIEADCEFLDSQLRYVYEWLPQCVSNNVLAENLERLTKRIDDRQNEPQRIRISF